MLARVADPERWRAWSRQVAHAGHCQRPVRVAGRAMAVDAATGVVGAEWTSEGAPDGTLLLACGDRRSSVCPACSETYRRDTWQLVAAGLRGRAPHLPDGADAVPVVVAEHPAALVTLTAPSFGAVHRVTAGEEVCRARVGPPVCKHGLRRWCAARHVPGDRLVGRALCVECYAYEDQVLFNAMVPELWRRTLIYTYRALARVAGERVGMPITVRAVRGLVRLSYVKVMEFQSRGAAHVHAVVRLDGVVGGERSAVVAPPSWADAAALEWAVREAAAKVRVPVPIEGKWAVRWGPQMDVATISDPGRTAAYLAKYATKSAGDTFAGLPVRRFGAREVGRVLRKLDNPHLGLLVLACFRLSRREGAGALRLVENVHSLGYRGHFVTKSRWYSVTRRTLGEVRRAWRVRGRPEDPWVAASGDPGTVLVAAWRYVGSGWASLGDAVLAETLARDHAAARANADLLTPWADPGGSGVGRARSAGQGMRATGDFGDGVCGDG
ncbi:replication initiator [Actinomadura litoris]|uniref:replication initiator n=1 Tax=Actinomadura litoris TaxID=2678616 RepID=UPI0027B88354|nr:replication initiator [Actinomadura litoris]